MRRLDGETRLKNALGKMPMMAELYQLAWAREEPPPSGYRGTRLASALPDWAEAALAARTKDATQDPRRVLVFGYLEWWLEYSCALALLLAGMGHEVQLGFLPYRRWMDPIPRFDARRQSAYLLNLLGGLRPLLKLRDLSSAPGHALPERLGRSIERQSLLDVQYTLKREELDWEETGEAAELFNLRLQRNRRLAASLLRLLSSSGCDVAIVPNGSILEFGALYRTARYHGLLVVTYEFGEQRERMWLAQDAEVMRLDASGLWAAKGDSPLSKAELTQLEMLYKSRRGGQLWNNFTRLWQTGQSQGALAARERLRLDPARPIVLLCTNVVGDSLALDRQVFTEGMADWLVRTVRHFDRRPGAQLVVRVHPGELLGAGHPSVEVVRDALPVLPPQVRVVPPESELNTYDLIELAHLGLVYTTTVGLELAMNGVPVVVAGDAHYRGKSFTEDPTSLQEYVEAIDRRLEEPLSRRLAREKVELAWRYAYRFFFEFPFPFPWHLLSFWDDVAACPVGELLAPSAREPYQATLAALLGGEIDWSLRGLVAEERLA